MDRFNQFIFAILARRRELPAQRALLVGVSGIDACGKGFLTAKAVTRLQMQGANAATIGVDGWLNLPQARFVTVNPARRQAVSFSLVTSSVSSESGVAS